MHVCYFLWSHTLHNDRSHYMYCDHTHQPSNAHIHSSTQHATRMSDHIELSVAQNNTPHMSLCGSNYCCFIAKHKYKLSTAASPLHFTYIPLYKTLSLSSSVHLYRLTSLLRSCTARWGCAILGVLASGSAALGVSAPLSPTVAIYSTERTPYRMHARYTCSRAGSER